MPWSPISFNLSGEYEMTFTSPVTKYYGANFGKIGCKIQGICDDFGTDRCVINKQEPLRQKLVEDMGGNTVPNTTKFDVQIDEIARQGLECIRAHETLNT